LFVTNVTNKQYNVRQHHRNINQSINQSIKTHFYSAICRERIRGAWWFLLTWNLQLFQIQYCN